MLRRVSDRKSPAFALSSRSLAALSCALACGWLLQGCAATRQQVATGLPSRHAVRSHQVLLLSDGKIPGEEEVLAELGQIRERLLTELEVPPGEREVVVYLFADRDRYAEYMRDNHPDLPARRAFFIGTPKELAVYAHWGEHILVDLRHEYTHGLLHSAVGRVPLWLDEGIAEYMEVGGDAPGHINSEHLLHLSENAAQGWRPDLGRLERLEQVDEMRREDYQEAWAWVHYLLHEAPGGRALLSNYLTELRRRQTPLPLSQQLGEPQSTAAELARYVTRLGAVQQVVPAGFLRGK